MTSPTTQPIEALEHAQSNIADAIASLDAALTAAESEGGALDSPELTREAIKAIAIARDGDPANSDHLSDAELVYEFLDYYRRDLHAVIELRRSGGDPILEYRRLLRAAEDAAMNSGGHERAKVLAEIADRWLNERLKYADQIPHVGAES